MGGVRVDTAMRTDVPGLLAAGEAVGGANGANRLSGNAITEALAFGRLAGAEAARQSAEGVPAFNAKAARPALALLAAEGPAQNTAALVARLQRLMSADVGPFRTAAGLARAAAALALLRAEIGTMPPGAPGLAHDLARLDWLDLRQMLLVAEAVVVSATARTESRGAHQREDFPLMSPGWERNLALHLPAGATTPELAA
jgi:succinate dehydrogenase/fumarate reductase flavoprotein subunit